MMKFSEIKLPGIREIRSKIQDFQRDVIRMMRLKFICVAMSILILVFIIMLTAINMIMNTVSRSQSMELLQQIAQSPRYDTLENFEDNRFEPPDGEPPDGMKPPGSDDPPEKPGGTKQSDTGKTLFAGEWQDGAVMSLDFRPGGWNPQPGGEPEPGNQDSGDQRPGGDFNPGQWNPRPNDWQHPQQPGVPPWADDDDDDDDDDSDDDDKPKNTSPALQQPPSEPPDAQPVTDAPTQPPLTQAPPQTEAPHQEEPTPPRNTTNVPPSQMIDALPRASEAPAGGSNPERKPHTSSATERTEPAHTQPERTEPAVPANALPAEQTEAPANTAPSTETTADSGSTASPATTVTTHTTPVQRNNETPPVPREPRMDRWKVAVTIDHFAIFVSGEGEYIGLRNTEDYTDEQAEQIMQGILSKSRQQGMYGWLQYCIADKSYGKLIVITDKTSDQGLLNNLFRTTVIIGVLMLLVLLVILIFLSRGITQPVEQAFTRQKQFVSDAGHELKTPLAVLTTNADILQDEIGENKWLLYMQEQIGRMNQLVSDLLRLARMDNAAQEYIFKDFDLSMAVAATTLPFESTAFEQHKNLEMDVQPGVHYCGSEQHIRQLCAIFIDNAIKYSNENGIIKVTLLQRGEHQILEFYNTGCEISPEETQKIFERFYRGDKARTSSQKSGYGLGLAIAKSIMEVHKIKFHVTCEQDRWIRFLLTL